MSCFLAQVTMVHLLLSLASSSISMSSNTLCFPMLQLIAYYTVLLTGMLSLVDSHCLS